MLFRAMFEKQKRMARMEGIDSLEEVDEMGIQVRDCGDSHSNDFAWGWFSIRVNQREH